MQQVCILQWIDGTCFATCEGTNENILEPSKNGTCEHLRVLITGLPARIQVELAPDRRYEFVPRALELFLRSQETTILSNDECIQCHLLFSSCHEKFSRLIPTYVFLLHFLLLYFFGKLCTSTAKQLYCVSFNLHTAPLTHSKTVTTSRNNIIITSMNKFTYTRVFYMAKISPISWLPSHPSLTRRRFGHPRCPPGVVVQHSICGDNQLTGWQKISEWARRSCISSALWCTTLLPHNIWATIDSISVGMSVYEITHIQEQLIDLFHNGDQI